MEVLFREIRCTCAGAGLATPAFGPTCVDDCAPYRRDRLVNNRVFPF